MGLMGDELNDFENTEFTPLFNLSNVFIVIKKVMAIKENSHGGIMKTIIQIEHPTFVFDEQEVLWSFNKTSKGKWIAKHPLTQRLVHFWMEINDEQTGNVCLSNLKHTRWLANVICNNQYVNLEMLGYVE